MKSGRTDAKNIVEEVERLAAPAVADCGFELVDVEFVKEGPDWFLRIFIDRAGGVTVDDCGIVSEKAGGLIDTADIIDRRYFLEVSSPGERPFRKDADFVRYKGELVGLKLYKALHDSGEKVFAGKLVGLQDDGRISISDENGTLISFDRAEVAIIHRMIVL